MCFFNVFNGLKCLWKWRKEFVLGDEPSGSIKSKELHDGSVTAIFSSKGTVLLN
jgi:hypothetical protein